MSKPIILVTDRVHPILIDKFIDQGYEVIYDKKVSMDTIASYLPNLTGVVINSKIQMNKLMIDLGSKLKFIVRLGSGLEIIDLDYAKSKGIKVINTPEGNRDAVAEHVIGMILCLANNCIQANKEVKTFNWNREKNRGFELKDKTIGIIGFGNTGSTLARKLSAWELNIIYHDKYIKKIGDYNRSCIKVSKEDILAKADIISLHLPLTDETKHYVNDDFISRCKDGAILVNTSRGKVVDTNALIRGLKSGKLGGACIDVFENEKPTSYDLEEKTKYRKLFDFENVVVSPHVAGWTNESLLRISTVALQKLNIM
jgi:D-3-phosphoglycerate dehydrogenase